MTDFSGKNFSKDYFSSLSDFVRKNVALEIAVTAVMLIIFGVKIFSYNVTLDTELYIGYNFTNWGGIGRYALIYLQKLLCLNEFSMFRENFLAALFLVLVTITSCHFIQFFSKDSVKKIPLWIFAISFVSNGIWVEQYYGTLQSGELAFVIFLIPFTVILLFDGLLNKNLFKLAATAVILAFFISVYQSLIVVFSAYFLIAALFMRNGNLIEEKKLWKNCFITLAVLAVSVILYSIAVKIIRIIINEEADTYLSNMREADRSYILNFMKYIYMQIFANNKIASGIFDPFMQKVARTGSEAIRTMHNGGYAVANIFYLPVLIFYFIQIFTNKNRSLLSILISLLTPVTMIIMPLSISGICDNRIQLMMPLVWSFLFFVTLSKITNKKILLVATVLISYSLYNQIYRSSMLFYSDQIRFERDAKVAADINRELVKLNSNDAPILLYGRTHFTYNKDFAYGENMGKSLFNCNSNHEYYNSTRRGVAFLRALNYMWKSAYWDSTVEEILEARKIAESMPSYPNEGFVRNLGNIVVVKLSEDVE